MKVFVDGVLVADNIGLDVEIADIVAHMEEMHGGDAVIQIVKTRDELISELWAESERRFKSQLEADDYDNLEQVMLLAYNGDDYAVSLAQWYKNMCDFWDARNEGDSYTENQHAWALRNIPKFEEVGE